MVAIIGVLWVSEYGVRETRLTQSAHIYSKRIVSGHWLFGVVTHHFSAPQGPMKITFNSGLCGCVFGLLVVQVSTFGYNREAQSLLIMGQVVGNPHREIDMYDMVIAARIRRTYINLCLSHGKSISPIKYVTGKVLLKIWTIFSLAIEDRNHVLPSIYPTSILRKSKFESLPSLRSIVFVLQWKYILNIIPYKNME